MPDQKETYRSYIHRMSTGEGDPGSQIAGMIAAQMLMAEAPPGAEVDEARILELQDKLIRQTSFLKMMQDPETPELAARGDGTGLVLKLADKENERRQELNIYARTPEQAPADAGFLKNVLSSLEDRSHGKSPLQLEQNSRRFYDMVKELDAARMACEQGAALDALQVRKLIHVCQRYIDGKEKIPGGEQERAAYQQAMCTLKQFMPEEEFSRYCRSINRAQKAKSPAQSRYADPGAFEAGRLSGDVRTAKEILWDARRELSRGIKLTDCATVAAVQELSKGNPNALIGKEELEKTKQKLMSPGSAFRKTMSDRTALRHFASLASKGKVMEMGRSMVTAAREHSVRTAQWHMNRSSEALVKGNLSGKAAVDHLANVLSAREIAVSASAQSQITNKAFQQKAETLKNDPSFADLASRYLKEPAFQTRINHSLQENNAAMDLEKAYEETKNPVKTPEEALNSH